MRDFRGDSRIYLLIAAIWGAISIDRIWHTVHAQSASISMFHKLTNFVVTPALCLLYLAQYFKARSRDRTI